MKFTEGYWLRSERSNELYAMCPYEVTPIENGLRVMAPEKVITNRNDTLNLGTITTDFTAAGDGIIKVVSRHYEAYADNEPRFEVKEPGIKGETVITEDYAELTAGNVSVRIDKKNWGYAFMANGKAITSCGFRNLGYMRYDRQVSSMFPEKNYLTENCSPYMMTELSLSPGECVYGFGERFTAFVKNGQVIETWNEDGGTSSQIAYKCVPFYTTNKGYGVFVDSTKHVSFETASEKVEYVGFSVPGEELRYYFIYGPKPARVLNLYTQLTGRPALPPAWSFGLWLSTSFTTSYDRATTDAFVNGMRERNIPLSVFHFDCFWMREFRLCDLEWDKNFFPDFEDTVRHYKEMGLKVCLWTNPYVAQGTEMFKEGAANGYFLRRADGRGVKQIDWWQPGTALIDFTNPAAREWFCARLKRLLDMGVDCLKSDFGERIPVDVAYYDGSDAASMHNYYTYLYNETVFRLLEREKGVGNAVLFARSATAGSQKFPVHWGGDCSASYASMAETLRGGLSLAMSGFGFWSHDISGFEQTATPDLYKRWAAFGLLSSHSRLHGSSSYRVPWLFDDEANDVVRFFAQLKCRLMPYIYSMAVKTKNTGTPTMRPMVFEFPDDPAAGTLDMQYMLGDSLLIAPVFNDEGVVDYYLPEGRWTHLLSGQERWGGRWYRDKYDYFSLPLFVRPGSVIAMGGEENRPDYDYARGVQFHVYCLGDGETGECCVPDVNGDIVLRFKAERKGDTVETSTSVPAEYGVVLHGMDGLNIVKR